MYFLKTSFLSDTVSTRASGSGSVSCDRFRIGGLGLQQQDGTELCFSSKQDELNQPWQEKQRSQRTIMSASGIPLQFLLRSVNHDQRSHHRNQSLPAVWLRSQSSEYAFLPGHNSLCYGVWSRQKRFVYKQEVSWFRRGNKNDGRNFTRSNTNQPGLSP